MAAMGTVINPKLHSKRRLMEEELENIFGEDLSLEDFDPLEQIKALKQENERLKVVADRAGESAKNAKSEASRKIDRIVELAEKREIELKEQSQLARKFQEAWKELSNAESAEEMRFLYKHLGKDIDGTNYQIEPESSDIKAQQSVAHAKAWMEPSVADNTFSPLVSGIVEAFADNYIYEIDWDNNQKLTVHDKQKLKKKV